MFSRDRRLPVQGSEFAFYSNQELIDELLRRTTFLGVVVHSTEEMRNRQWGGERVMRVQFNENLTTEQAGRLLDVVAAQLTDQSI
jgi:hypothetical protein